MDFISIPRDKSGIIAGGMHLALSILIFVFIVPRIMLSLIDKGPTEIGLVVIFAALPICAICILDVYFPLRVKWFLYIGELFSLGILSLITGLLFEFEIDSESLPTMIIFSLLFMVCYNVISSGFHLRTLKGLEKSVKSNQNNLSLLWTTLYLVLPWIIYTIAGIFNRNPISWIFYTIGILALITATFVILSPKSVVSLEKKPRWVKSVGLRIDDFILGLLFGLFVAFLFFGGYYLHPQNIGFAFSGVAIGFWLFSYLTAFNKKFLLVLESTGIFAFVMILQYNWEILGGWWALFGIGLFLGLLFGEISERMSNFSADRKSVV